MSAMASQFTGVSTVCSNVCSCADQWKHQSVICLCKGNPLVTCVFPSQRTSDMENASIWWRHHGQVKCTDGGDMVLWHNTPHPFITVRRHCSQTFNTSAKLDMSTTRRRRKSPWSLSGTSADPTMVTLLNIMVMNGWLASFSFPVNRPSHSWDKAISDSDLETPRSRSCVRSKDKVIQSAQYPINSLPFSFHINETNNSWDTVISKFDLETSKVKVPSEIKGQGHILYAVSNRCTSFLFHINRTNHSWDIAKIVFELEKTHLQF